MRCLESGKGGVGKVDPFDTLTIGTLGSNLTIELHSDG